MCCGQPYIVCGHYHPLNDHYQHHQYRPLHYGKYYYDTIKDFHHFHPLDDDYHYFDTDNNNDNDHDHHHDDHSHHHDDDNHHHDHHHHDHHHEQQSNRPLADESSSNRTEGQTHASKSQHHQNHNHDRHHHENVLAQYPNKSDQDGKNDFIDHIGLLNIFRDDIAVGTNLHRTTVVSSPSSSSSPSLGSCGSTLESPTNCVDPIDETIIPHDDNSSSKNSTTSASSNSSALQHLLKDVESAVVASTKLLASRVSLDLSTTIATTKMIENDPMNIETELEKQDKNIQLQQQKVLRSNPPSDFAKLQEQQQHEHHIAEIIKSNNNHQHHQHRPLLVDNSIHPTVAIQNNNGKSSLSVSQFTNTSKNTPYSTYYYIPDESTIDFTQSNVEYYRTMDWLDETMTNEIDSFLPRLRAENKIGNIAQTVVDDCDIDPVTGSIKLDCIAQVAQLLLYPGRVFYNFYQLKQYCDRFASNYGFTVTTQGNSICCARSHSKTSTSSSSLSGTKNSNNNNNDTDKDTIVPKQRRKRKRSTTGTTETTTTATGYKAINCQFKITSSYHRCSLPKIGQTRSTSKDSCVPVTSTSSTSESGTKKPYVNVRASTQIYITNGCIYHHTEGCNPGKDHKIKIQHHRTSNPMVRSGEKTVTAATTCPAAAPTSNSSNNITMQTLSTSTITSLVKQTVTSPTTRLLASAVDNEKLSDDTFKEARIRNDVEDNVPMDHIGYKANKSKNGCCYSPLISVSCPQHHHEQQLEMAATISTNVNTKYQKQIVHHAMELADTVQYSERGCEFVINTLIGLKRFLDHHQHHENSNRPAGSQQIFAAQVSRSNDGNTNTCTGASKSSLELPPLVIGTQPEQPNAKTNNFDNNAENRQYYHNNCSETMGTSEVPSDTTLSRNDGMNQKGSWTDGPKDSNLQEYEEWMTLVPTLFNDDEFVSSLGLNQE